MPGGGSRGPSSAAARPARGHGTAQEVGAHPGAGTASPPIDAPGCAGPRSRPDVDRRVGDREAGQGPAGGLVVPEHGPDLGPHDIAGEDRSRCEAGPKCLERRPAEVGLVEEDVQEDGRIDRRDHEPALSGPAPRSSRMIASVPPRGRGRIPTSSSSPSAGTSFRPTRRPPASSKSRTVPGRSPRRSRSRFGMVIWPFSLTVVFIPSWYEFRTCLLYTSPSPRD